MFYYPWWQWAGVVISCVDKCGCGILIENNCGLVSPSAGHQLLDNSNTKRNATSALFLCLGFIAIKECFIKASFRSYTLHVVTQLLISNFVSGQKQNDLPKRCPWFLIHTYTTWNIHLLKCFIVLYDCRCLAFARFKTIHLQKAHNYQSLWHGVSLVSYSFSIFPVRSRRTVIYFQYSYLPSKAYLCYV